MREAQSRHRHAEDEVRRVAEPQLQRAVVQAHQHRVAPRQIVAGRDPRRDPLRVGIQPARHEVVGIDGIHIDARERDFARRHDQIDERHEGERAPIRLDVWARRGWWT